MFKSYKIEGIVIKRVNFSEADKLLTIYTKNRGKIKVIAKGIRKIKSRRAPHLEPFNQIVAFIAQGKTFGIVTEVLTKQSFSNIKKDLLKIVYAYRMIEEIDKICPEQEPHPQVYNLLIKSLTDLDGLVGKYDYLLDAFTRKLLINLGFLSSDKILEGDSLEYYFESIIENSLKSKRLLSKL